MRFYTIDVYNAWYRDSDPDASTAAYNKYLRYLDSIKRVLPENLRHLALLRGVDDGLIAEARHDRAAKRVNLILRCGDLQMGYYDLVLEYRDALITPDHEKVLA